MRPAGRSMKMLPEEEASLRPVPRALLNMSKFLLQEEDGVVVIYLPKPFQVQIRAYANAKSESMEN
jgi:hypothetical protein